jgi:hypothetical protein
MAAASAAAEPELTMPELYAAIAAQKAKIKDLKAAGTGKVRTIAHLRHIVAFLPRAQ